METVRVNTHAHRIFAATLVAIALGCTPATAQNEYDPGVTDSEIKIGNIVPYTGLFSEYGAIGRAEAAYFQMINDRGGVNGRRINFISVDNGSDVSKNLALARQLVEQDEVLLTVGTWGTNYSLAIRPYLNEKKVPQLFVAATSSKFADPSRFPWTMGFQASGRTEGSVYAKYILRTKPDAKIAVLYANNEDSNEWLAGVHDGLGEKASTMIVKEAPFSYSDPTTLDSQILALKSSGADVFINLTVGRFATEAIRKAYDIDWHPLQLIPNASLSIAAFLDPAGLEKAVGIVSNARSKGWSTSQEKRDPAVLEFLEWMKKYNAKASERDANNVYGYEVAQTLVEVLKKCGDDLTRANVMRQATSLDLELGMLRPGIRITTSATDYRPIKQLYLLKFDGKGWVPFGGVIGD
jgi:branched-chain amino acid transport system substrate-binding protein